MLHEIKKEATLKISLGTQKGTGAIRTGPTMIKPFIDFVPFFYFEFLPSKLI